MKAACVILSFIPIVGIITIVCMAKFATYISVEEKKRDFHSEGIYRYSKLMGVISLNDNHSATAAERFPYVAAIMKIDPRSWSFSCFGSFILTRWVVTAAHCRTLGHVHRVLLYGDFAKNYTHTYPIILWRIHEAFSVNDTTPMYDIAVAKLDVDAYPVSPRPALFDGKPFKRIETGVWKTVVTMDSKVYLTNEFANFDMAIVDYSLCYESYGVELNASMLCVDMRMHDDCFVAEFGPMFSHDRVVGLLAVKPKDCENRLAIFTNVSFYYSWILRSTYSAVTV